MTRMMLTDSFVPRDEEKVQEVPSKELHLQKDHHHEHLLHIDMADARALEEAGLEKER